MIKEFSREDLRNPENSILCDFKSDHDTLLICFSGLAPDLDKPPPFEFSGVLRDFDTKKMFVRDNSNYAYHNGLKNLSNTFSGSTEILAKEVKRSGCKRVVTIGNCQGGYAAIYFGAMLKADLVLTFAPITYVDAENRARYNETRWEVGFERIYSSVNAEPDLYDLGAVPETKNIPIEIYYDPGYSPDTNMVQNFIAGKSNVAVHERPGGEHMLVRNLRRSGELEEILKKVLSPERAVGF